MRTGADVLLDVLRFLREHALLEARGALCSILGVDGSSNADREAWLGLDEVERRLLAAGDDGARVLTLSGMRTGDGFPNLFWEYANDEATLAGTLRIVMVCGSTPASRGFEMEFSEVDFLDETPVLTLTSLHDALTAMVGAPLTLGCFNEDPAEMLEGA